MNARWQQASILGGWALAVLWLWWQWPQSPALALGGVLALLLFPAWSIGTQFVCLLLAPRDAMGELPPVAARAMLRAFLAEVGLAYRIFGWRQPFRTHALADDVEADAGSVGVVLVHGYLCNRAFWQPWQRLFAARRIPCIAVTLEPAWGSIDDCVPDLDAAVRRMAGISGRPPVVIGHSMGGLVIRAWLRSRGAVVADGVSEAQAAQRLQALVARVITLAAPHRGTWIANFSHSLNGRQMRLDSDWLRTLAAQEPQALAARMTCWYSNCDNLVMPALAATYPGADNRLIVDQAHVQLVFDAQLMQDCAALVEQA
ncbi:triacylglycerol lipase [Pantoea sp. 18069]|uniref:esterase/lipase family protein n=1 Tax=Pantoea sp. 18069 TaxID=2681415 RepID=UPI00135B26CA|nr:alpha/beta fold hydrolase [Pantoea sp. 18069]